MGFALVVFEVVAVQKLVEINLGKTYAVHHRFGIEAGELQEFEETRLGDAAVLRRGGQHLALGLFLILRLVLTGGAAYEISAIVTRPHISR